ncbi:putative leader peptide [Streptomyces nondiastaticus]|uniref:putative leader peptide n=1 Tax=Streptomyces nondiastaticus TaxID=3154512 RepID=UPI00341682CE
MHGPRGRGIPLPGNRRSGPLAPVSRRVVYDGRVTMLVKRRHVDLLRVTSMSCRRYG